MKPYKLTSKKFKRYTIVEPDMSLYRKARSNDLKDKNTLFNAGNKNSKKPLGGACSNK